MSEKREGWLGYMVPQGASGEMAQTYVWRTNGGGECPVWVKPLDPDGPKPGGTWEWREWRGSPVTLSAPYCIAKDGSVISWWTEEGYIVPAHKLSPIKPTRTVEIELTEDEVEEIRAAVHPAGLSVVRKLAEALEATP